MPPRADKQRRSPVDLGGKDPFGPGLGVGNVQLYAGRGEDDIALIVGELDEVVTGRIQQIGERERRVACLELVEPGLPHGGLDFRGHLPCLLLAFGDLVEQEQRRFRNPLFQIALEHALDHARGDIGRYKHRHDADRKESENKTPLQ